ncbi:hypothetical protein [Streptomyces viridosporus]|uniref:Uncharacterized protein n=1 Tax=Streptomyces viridosporus T7A TaxID=665577 RepID=A0ABX6A7K2_STRVD|nr:hypothetical protein [Streptomyces viridosporus]QEU83377.1 hypothetical protein CP969_00150 [Streptomyces viridosporus T7A]
MAHRSELDALAVELAKRLQEVEAEREELGIAERVLRRLAEQDRAYTEAAGVGGLEESAGGGACGAADPASW